MNKYEEVVQKTYELTIPVVNTIIEEIYNGKAKGVSEKMIELVILCAVAKNDISTLFWKYNEAKYDYERNMYVRLLALSMYETIINKIDRFKNNAVKESMDLKNNGDIQIDFTQIKTETREFKKLYEKELKEIRHNSSGHINIDSDLLKTYKLIFKGIDLNIEDAVDRSILITNSVIDEIVRYIKKSKK